MMMSTFETLYSTFAGQLSFSGKLVLEEVLVHLLW
jgi:hypothetical protein